MGNETVTYKYNCGHELTVDVMDVLMLKVEPNWGCTECEDAQGEPVDRIFMEHWAKEFHPIVERGSQLADNIICSCNGEFCGGDCPCSYVPCADDDGEEDLEDSEEEYEEHPRDCVDDCICECSK